MAQLIGGVFNAMDYNPAQVGGSFDIGRHKVVIEKSEVKGTKAGDGGMVVLTLKAVEGPNTGTSMDYRINLYNASAKSVEIAQRQMSAVCHVTGVFQIQDTQQLHGIPFIVEVRKQKDDDRYNEVGAVFDVNGNEPGKSGQQQGQQGNFGGQQQQQGPGQGAFGGGQQQQQQQQQGFGGGQQQGGFGQQQQQPQTGFGGGQQQQGQGGFGQGQQQQQQGGFGQQPNGFGQQQQQQPVGQQQAPQWQGNNGGQQQQPNWGQQ